MTLTTRRTLYGLNIILIAALGVGSAILVQRTKASVATPERSAALPLYPGPLRALEQTNTGGTPTSAPVATPVTWEEYVSAASLSITTTMMVSEEVAEGVVTAVYPGKFNTSSGGPPNSGSPNNDNEDVADSWAIYRTVVLEVDHWYKGESSNTHLVLVALGGSYDGNSDGNPEYIQNVKGLDLVDVAIGDRYLVYGVYPWTVPPEDAVGERWEERALDVAEQMTGQSHPALFVEDYAAYKIVGSSAQGISDHATVPVAWLRQITEDLAGE